VTRGQFAAFVKLTKYKTDAEKKGFSYVYKDGAFVNDKGRHWRNPGISQKDDHPVVCVSWNDAMAFCKWLSERTGRKVRLPTEAEWEYACRAGTDTSYHFGNTVSPGEANFDGSPTGGVFRQKTVSVASFTPNRWYLYGMHGNAAEWCTDWHTPTIPPGDVVDPQGPPSRPHRVFRGGTWYSFAEDIRADSRGGIGPDYRNWGLGFRIVMETK
jgi:formylglycine-generating enzyme required for sulfatase activity